MNRIEKMDNLADVLTSLIYLYGRRKDIDVTYAKLNEEMLQNFSDFQIQYNRLRIGEEYFFIWENEPERGLLYVVCVTADSELTAAYEAIELISRKF